MNSKIRLLFAVLAVIFFLTGCAAIKDYITGEAPAEEGVTEIPLEEIPVGEEKPVETPEEKPTEAKPEEAVKEAQPQIELTAEEEKLPRIVVNETQLVQLQLSATDPDGDTITYKYSAPLDKGGKWQTKIGDGGKYRVTVTASDGKSETKQDVMLIVIPLNQPPVIDIPSKITTNEGETLELKPRVTDPEGEKVTVKYSGWMDSETKKVGYEDAGIHDVKITASDGEKELVKNVQIVVNNVNRAPIITPINDMAATAGDKVVVDVTAADPDRDDVTLTFSEPLSKNGEWQTSEKDIGKYKVTITASDGKLITERTIILVVVSKNKPPVIEKMNDINVSEGDTVKIEVKASDPENDKLSYSIDNNKFQKEDNVFTWKTTYNDGNGDPSIYVVTVSAADGVNKASQAIRVTVKDVNRPPVFKIE